jgi:hypothetical protein
LEAPPGE